MPGNVMGGGEGFDFYFVEKAYYLLFVLRVSLGRLIRFQGARSLNFPRICGYFLAKAFELFFIKDFTRLAVYSKLNPVYPVTN